LPKPCLPLIIWIAANHRIGEATSDLETDPFILRHIHVSEVSAHSCEEK
jgi:hypothetical protein